MRNRAF